MMVLANVQRIHKVELHFRFRYIDDVGKVAQNGSSPNISKKRGLRSYFAWNITPKLLKHIQITANQPSIQHQIPPRTC